MLTLVDVSELRTCEGSLEMSDPTWLKRTAIEVCVLIVLAVAICPCYGG